VKNAPKITARIHVTCIRRIAMATYFIADP
jgi:hypothetical protein